MVPHDFPDYGFLLMLNSNIRSNSAPLQDIRLWDLSDLELDISRSSMMAPLNYPYMVSY